MTTLIAADMQLFRSSRLKAGAEEVAEWIRVKPPSGAGRQ